ncbi:MAG: hypothetical protein E7437_06160 [Ruminococcaceae bacterium]|nr:hypothetical protein [Oscillospiraceae bacterium]
MNHNRKRLLATLLALFLTASGCAQEAAQTQTETKTESQAVTEQSAAPSDPGTVPTEPGAVALPTKYIVLSYPEEIADRVTVSYEDQKDGQAIIFTTDITGESLELFRFTIGSAADAGYVLGTLEDPDAGSLTVCADVKDYSNGNLDPDVYNELIDLQTRVNDIIVRFHEDERFVPNV